MKKLLFSIATFAMLFHDAAAADANNAVLSFNGYLSAEELAGMGEQLNFIGDNPMGDGLFFDEMGNCYNADGIPVEYNRPNWVDMTAPVVRSFTFYATCKVGSGNLNIKIFYGARSTVTVGNAATALTNGNIQTGTFTDTAGLASAFTAAASSSQLSIEEFVAYCHRNPIALNYINISSTSTSQAGQTLTVNELDPFKAPDVTPINMAALATTFDQNLYVRNIQLTGLVLGPDVEIITTIPDGATSTFTFVCGVTKNSAEQLKQTLYGQSGSGSIGAVSPSINGQAIAMPGQVGAAGMMQNIRLTQGGGGAYNQRTRGNVLQMPGQNVRNNNLR